MEKDMKYLKEITSWSKAPNTPNHTYIFNEKDESVALNNISSAILQRLDNK